MWWGYSQPLDFRREISNETEDEDAMNDPLELLVVGAGDARHVIKTLASAYKHTRRRINFHLVEPYLEQVARSILLLSTTLEQHLGVQEATRYFLELMGNILLRPATAKYLVQRAWHLIDVPTQTIDCPWLNLNELKHKDRDNLESILKFWERTAREGLPVVEYWDRRVRKSLESRYDYREGVFDWDYYMVLKQRSDAPLTSHEYRFWRNNGIAFTWIEGEPARCNPTLISNIASHGSGFLHHAYTGDVTVGPYFTWSLETASYNENTRATDVAEREVMRAIHEIRHGEPMSDHAVAGHRDPGLLDAVIATAMPSSDIEQEKWSPDVTSIEWRDKTIEWKAIPEFQVIFHPVKSLPMFKYKDEFRERFDLIWIAGNMTGQVSNVAPLAKIRAKVIIEARKFMVNQGKEDLQAFGRELMTAAEENGLGVTSQNPFDAEKDSLARFIKISAR